MKWFKHHSDANTNLKLRIIVRELGMEGYGLYWFLLELVAQQGENFRIKREKEWKMAVMISANIEQKKLEVLLNRFSELDLIDRKGLAKGILYIPKIGEYSDEYTKRVRRVSEQDTDNVPLEEKRIDKKRREENKEEKIEFDIFWDLYDKKVGRPKSESKWKKLSLQEQRAIIEYLPAYKTATPDKTYRKDPLTFFNNRSWEDEIVGKNTSPGIKRSPEEEERIRATQKKVEESKVRVPLPDSLEEMRKGIGKNIAKKL